MRRLISVFLSATLVAPFSTASAMSAARRPNSPRPTPTGPAAKPLPPAINPAAIPRIIAAQDALGSRAPHMNPAQASAEAAAMFEGRLPDQGSAVEPQSLDDSPQGLMASGASAPAVKKTVPSPKPARGRLRRLVTRIGTAVIVLAATGYGIYKYLGPGISAVAPPPVTISSNATLQWLPDSKARIVKAPDATQPSLEYSLDGIGETSGLSFDASGKFAVSVAKDGSWRLWDLEQQTAARPSSDNGSARAAAHAGGSVVVLEHGGAVKLINIGAGTVSVMETSKAQSQTVAQHAFSPDASYVAVAMNSGMVVTLDLKQAKTSASKITGEVLTMATTEKGTILATTKMGQLAIAKIAHGQPPSIGQERPMLGAVPIASASAANGSRILGAGSLASVESLIAVQTEGAKYEVLPAASLGADVHLKAIALDADGSRGAILSTDGRVWVWFIEFGETTLVGRSSNASTIQFSLDGKHLLVTTSTGADVWTAPE